MITHIKACGNLKGEKCTFTIGMINNRRQLPSRIQKSTLPKSAQFLASSGQTFFLQRKRITYILTSFYTLSFTSLSDSSAFFPAAKRSAANLSSSALAPLSLQFISEPCINPEVNNKLDFILSACKAKRKRITTNMKLSFTKQSYAYWNGTNFPNFSQIILTRKFITDQLKEKWYWLCPYIQNNSFIGWWVFFTRFGL